MLYNKACWYRFRLCLLWIIVIIVVFVVTLFFHCYYDDIKINLKKKEWIFNQYCVKKHYIKTKVSNSLIIGDRLVDNRWFSGSKMLFALLLSPFRWWSIWMSPCSCSSRNLAACKRVSIADVILFCLRVASTKRDFPLFSPRKTWSKWKRR